MRNPIKHIVRNKQIYYLIKSVRVRVQYVSIINNQIVSIYCKQLGSVTITDGKNVIYHNTKPRRKREVYLINSRLNLHIYSEDC